MNLTGGLSKTAQATLLLTSYFSKSAGDDAKPLSNTEWGRFALWLKENALSPAELLVNEPSALLSNWHDSKISSERIVKLLNRGHSLALAMEKWQRAGLWVVTRSDPEYPKRLKKRLDTNSPPVLFGCGNRQLLNAGGLAVIGSRNAAMSELSFAGKLGEKAAHEGVNIVSGGARGVDQESMLGAVNANGYVIGILADSLLKSATSSKWRKGLMNGNVVLISPFYPEAGFNAGNAMARNKYIYCLADSSLVVHSGKKGGTWSGAEENLKKSWVPLWVRPTSDKEAGNADLVAKGGKWCEADVESLIISDLFLQVSKEQAPSLGESQDLFAMADNIDLFGAVGSEVLDATSYCNVDELGPQSPIASPPIPEDKVVESTRIDFYQIFIAEFKRLAQRPVTVDYLVEATGLHKSQLHDWLKRAEEDCVATKLNRPVRYQVK
ncbi:DNA-processing protein DprA [Shewanella sp.]|uniref:DNA-processing protein DprA n=1 Tax=Shewanella sp. TaxID=50422 RepID=UPI003A97AAD1